MNGEVPSVPITTLAGIASLTDLLPQLPLPTPLPNAVNNKSLLCSPQLAEDAQRILARPEDSLVDQLVYALAQSSTEHIELKDSHIGGALDGEMPSLLKAIIAKDSTIFNKGPGKDGAVARMLPNSQPVSPYPGSQMAQFSPYPQMNSPRVNQQLSPGHCAGPSSPCVRNSTHPFSPPNSSSSQFQQAFQKNLSSQKLPETGAVNGDDVGPLEEEAPNTARSRSVRTRPPGCIMNSPAQASIAETTPHQPVAQPSFQTNEHSQRSHNIDTVDKPLEHKPVEIMDSTPSTSAMNDGERPGASEIMMNMSCASKTKRKSKKGGKRKGKRPYVALERMKDISGPSKRAGQPVVVLQPLDPKEINLVLHCNGTLESIASGGTVKTEHKRRDHDRRGSKRRNEEESYDYRSSLSERVKRRKRHSSHRDTTYSDEEEMSDSSSRSRSGTPIEILQKKKRDKRLKRMNKTDMSIEELLDSPTFRKFSQAMEYIFDSAEEVNFGSLDPDDEEATCPPESLISRSVLSSLCGEAAKLKSMAVFNQIPAEKLVKLLTILQWNIRDGTKLLPNMCQDMDDEEENKLWRDLSMDRVSRSMDACLTAIYIITSPKMPKQVFLEDVIERIIMYGKFQLQNTIYPEFDPVYRVDPKDKDGYHGSLKLKRARAGQVKHKSTISLYNRLSDLVGNLAELVEIQELTDTVILQISTLGVSPFFVENISELQLNAMKLVTTVFAHYNKHRQLILEDIFASLARLPSSKRNLRNYRLNADESTQMVTALALQLIQCVAKLPQSIDPDTHLEEEEEPEGRREKARHKRKSLASDPDVVIVSSYETAMRTGHNFLSVFLKKCTMKGEDDYRPLFENFVQDLLSTVNKPEWPASELLLSLLGRILVEQFSNRHVDMSLRTASLEYLGIAAARLRKDAVSSQFSQEIIDDIVSKVHDDDSDQEFTGRAANGHDKPEKSDDEKDETEELQKAMLDYLAYNGQNEPAYLFARQFYIAQWFRDTMKEVKKNKKEDEEFDEHVAEHTTEVFQNAERRKKFLLSQVETNYKPFSTFKPSPSKLDYDSACLVARYLSSKRPFAQSFDIYLTQILKVLSENVVAVRTKAMKCLTAVVEADPGVLAREDMESGVHGRFLDPSTSVREAAIELVGKFILIRPDLIPQYYNMLSERILDTGISVRKRVIKIFRDVFVEQPDFKMIPDMCVKMIRRVNDEEGIKKLVNEVFQSMWFTPLSSREKDPAKLIQRVVNITEVVAASKDTGYEFIEQLLDNLLKKDEHGNHNKSALTACRQIVDCLVENVLRLEEKSVDGQGCSQRLIACLSTLFLFSRIKPDLMLQHATTLQPYLDIKCSNQGDFYVLHYVAKILELVVPLMEHPSETFLAQVEEDLIKLILNHGMMVLQSCVACLGAIVNNVSHNYSLVKDCFQKFFNVLSQCMAYHQENPGAVIEAKRKPTTLRSLFTVGLMCKHFDFDSKEMGERKFPTTVKDRVFDVLVYFTAYPDEDVQHKALTGLGFMAVRHFEFMLGRTMKELYNYLLSEDAVDKLKCQALKNLSYYLVEEEVRMSKSDADWKKHSKEEDLRDMGDVQSGMASTIMQVYLKKVLEVFFHPKSEVRLEALNVIQLVLRQGLIHPVQCVPYLITMGTDNLAAIRIKADQQLQEIEKKYPGFIHMKALQGIKLCYRLQKILQKEGQDGVIRGLRNPDDNSTSLNAFLYTVLRTNRSHRRAILTSLLNLFDDSGKISLTEQLYIADNLAFFTYQTQEEPLFIIHQIDIIVSVSGSNLLQSFRERLVYPDDRKQKIMTLFTEQNGETEEHQVVSYDDDDEDEKTLLERLPATIAPLKDVILLAQGCILLLYIKQHLKDMYGFTDSKIQNYSPTEAAKVYDKPLSKKTLVKFNPECVLNRMRSKKAVRPKHRYMSDEEDDNEEKVEQVDGEDDKRKIVQDFLEFKDLMLSVDPPDDDDSDDAKSAGRKTPVPGKGEPADQTGQTVEQNGVEAKEVIEIDGEGDAHPVNQDKDSPNVDIAKPRIPPVIISTSKYQTPSREKEKKKSHQSRAIRLLGASQLQASAHTNTTQSSSHTPHSSHSRSHHSHSHSHSHRSTPSSSSSSSRKKKTKKHRKRYASDYSDDDSDFDPDYC